MSTIIFLSQALPYPPDTGATRRTFHVLRELQREFEVVLVPFSRRGHQPDAGARAEAEKELAGHVARVLPSVPFPGEWSKARLAWDHGRALLTGHPYSWYQYGLPEFGRRIDEALRGSRPDLLHMDSIDLFPWLRRFLQNLDTKL